MLVPLAAAAARKCGCLDQCWPRRRPCRQLGHPGWTAGWPQLCQPCLQCPARPPLRLPAGPGRQLRPPFRWTSLQVRGITLIKQAEGPRQGLPLMQQQRRHAGAAALPELEAQPVGLRHSRISSALHHARLDGLQVSPASKPYRWSLQAQAQPPGAHQHVGPDREHDLVEPRCLSKPCSSAEVLRHGRRTSAPAPPALTCRPLVYLQARRHGAASHNQPTTAALLQPCWGSRAAAPLRCCSRRAAGAAHRALCADPDLWAGSRARVRPARCTPTGAVAGHRLPRPLHAVCWVWLPGPDGAVPGDHPRPPAAV